MIAHPKTVKTLTALFLAAAFWSWACAAPAGAGSRPAAETQKQKKRKTSDDKNPQYQYEMGVIALRYGLPDEAIRYGKVAVSLDPGHFDGWNLLGLAYSNKAEFDLSAEAYERAAAIKPGSADVQRGLGLAYAELKETEKAEAALKKSFDIDAAYETAYHIGKLYYGAGRFEEALDYTLKSIQKNGKNAGAYNLKGVILNQLGRYAEAAGKLPGRSRSRARRYQPAGQPGHRLAQQRRTDEGPGRVRGRPAQDRAGRAEKARRGIHPGHQGRREVASGKRRSSPRRKASPLSTKVRPSGQRSWKMPRSKAKSPSRVL